MKRDFSSEAEEEILRFAEMKEENDYCIEFSPEEIEVYEYNGTDIEYHMNNIRLHHQYLVDRMNYTSEAVERIFDNVREFDREYSEKIYGDKVTTLSSYKKSMQALLDSIRMSPSGESFSTVDYVRKVKEQYETAGSISGAYGSIFGDSRTFADRLQKAGSGLLGVTYQALQEEEAFEALMKKSLEEVKPWEVAALSRLFDDCMIQDENGKYQVDFEALSALIDRCYVRTNFREPISQHDVTAPGAAAYELAPIVEGLLFYRELQTDGLVSLYMNPDARKSMNLTQEFIMSECYITDSIYSVSEYYSKITLNSWLDEDYSQLHIGIDNSQTGMIRLSVANDGEGDWGDITIYGFTSDLSTAINQANMDSEAGALLDTEEEILIAVLDKGVKHTTKAVTGLIPGAGTVMELYGGAKEFYSIWEVYRSSEDNNAECYSKMQGLELQDMTDILNCSGTGIQYGEAVTVRHLAIDQREITIDVALYNEYREEQVPAITVSQLEEEFAKVVAGEARREDCAGIQTMWDFALTGRGDTQEHPISRYNEYIREYLKKEYGIQYIDQASMKQLETATEMAAYRWHNWSGEY